MRRNFPRNKPAPQNGPLMTNHIELQHLDLELELLKRKREMIEKQQQQLTNERQYNNHQRQYNYNEPRQFHGQQQQFNSNQNFSNNFGPSSAPPLMGNHFGGSILGKRPNDSKWNSNSAPKRFSGPQGGSKKKFGAPDRRSDPIDRPAPFAKHQGPIRNQNSQPKAPNQPPQPWNQLPFYMGSSSVPPSQRFNSSKSKPVYRDFKPSKVTKPKATSSNLANKLVSYPLPKRKDNPIDAPKVWNDEPRDNFILHADKVPTQQVAGRLELALGSILKDIKQQFATDSQYKASFLSHLFLREVKQAIRERLRTVMIGKHVGKVGTIVDQYRNVFPLESDSEIVTVALEAQKAANNKQIHIKLEDTDSPESYFKTNMDQLICKSLDEMFKKLYNIYSGDHPEEVKQAVRELMEENPQDFSKDVMIYNMKDLDQTMDDENVETSENDVPNEEKEKNGESDKKEEEEENVENDKPMEDEVKTESAPEAKTESGPEVETDSGPEVKTDSSPEVKTDGDPEAKTNTSNTSDTKTDEKSAPTEFQLKQRMKRMEYVIGSILKRRIATIFPKYRNILCKILNESPQYLEAKEAIVAKLQDKLSIETRMEAAKLRNASAIKDTSTVSERPTSTPTAAPRILPYYVKIFGRPGLPKRKQMQSFLQKYNPKSIKKHRNMHLLFVGFDNKEDFNRMLDVKECTIGSCKINIKISEKTVNESQNETLNLSAISGDADDEVHLVEGDNKDNSSDIINPDLDDQISNLLSSIRQEEERSESKEDTIEKEEAIEPTENGQSEEVAAKDDDVVIVPDEEKNEEIATDKNTAMESESTDKTDNEEADKLEPLKSEDDKLEVLKGEEKETGRATPTRASTRLATSTPTVTPNTIRTRRASRLAQN